MAARTVSTPELVSLLEPLADQLRGAGNGPRVVAVRAQPVWTGPASITVAGVPVRVVACGSVLAVRDTLAGAGDEAVAVLTDRADDELGADLRARLIKRRALTPDRWDAVARLFGATRLDPRFSAQRWLPDELLAAAPVGGYPRVPGGVLTLDAALGALAEQHLGLTDLAPDPVRLLAWADRADSAGRFATTPQVVAERVVEVISETVPFAPALFAAMALGPGRDIVALGLVCGVLAAGDATPQAVAAAARLEGRLGGRRLSLAGAQAWGHAAGRYVDEHIGEPALRQRILDQAEALLTQIDAAELAICSEHLRLGWRQRLAAAGVALSEALAEPATPAETLSTAVDAVVDHRLALLEPRRVETLRLAERLVRWLRQPDPPSPALKVGESLSSLARRYRDDIAWAGRARRLVRDGDAVPEVATAYQGLVTATDQRHAEFHRPFAVALARHGVDLSDPGMLGVEQVIDRVVAPLARLVPILLVVLDGMGWDVWHGLAHDLAGLGWNRCVDPDGMCQRPVVAALPTVTQVSRTSLLAGRLVVGQQNDEKAAFPTHPALLGVSRPGRPPLLFHKVELADAHGLAPAVSDAIAEGEQQIVACVVNAIDDHLLKGDQVRVDWDISHIHPLGVLLERARYAGRALVVTADHGHQLEAGSIARVAEGAGERWRTVSSPPAGADEVRLAGPRVLLGGGAVIAPWVEQVRYSASKRNGYHGGATATEALVPLEVLVAGEPPAGWTLAPWSRPRWWSRAGTAVAAAVAAAATIPASFEPAVLIPTGQIPLFDREPVSWIDELLASEVLRDARARHAGRSVPDERLRAVLVAL
ncbi:MAG TPA: BREX-2 system phosphatase PglZ, partial [Acidimicrobiales bacterium]|nr:BREX-2 system phosphatase PglZ [Acidimicrobiales bacterium]